MALLPVSTDYTDKDFDSVRRRLFALIQSVFPTWTDIEVANFGNIMVEMFAFVGDIVGFYQDNQAIESRIATATQRKNLLALARLINYEPATATPAQVLQRFTANPPPAPGDTVVLGGAAGPGVRNPYPIVVKTGDSDEVKYELQQLVTLTDTEPTAWGLVENSEAHVETFQSTGFIGMELRLSNRPYLDGTTAIVAVNGEYTEVESFLNSSATDRHFTLHVDNNDTPIIRFGDQVNGQIPTGDIIVYYKTGGGSRGNVDADSITVLDGSFQTQAGASVAVSTLNAGERAVGGKDRETEAQIRVKAPESLRVLTRAVAREDFEILARQFGMARALLLTSEQDGRVPLNTGHLYMVPSAERDQPVSLPTPAQMDQVMRRIRSDYPYLTTFLVLPKQPVFLNFSVYVKVFLRKGYSPAEASEQLGAALRDYFALYNADGSVNTRVDFGYYYESGASDNAKVLPLSDLINAVRDCTAIHRLGVHQADFTVTAITDVELRVVLAHSDVPIHAHEFPRLTAVRFQDGATGVYYDVDL